MFSVKCKNNTLIILQKDNVIRLFLFLFRTNLFVVYIKGSEKYLEVTILRNFSACNDIKLKNNERPGKFVQSCSNNLKIQEIEAYEFNDLSLKTSRTQAPRNTPITSVVIERSLQQTCFLPHFLRPMMRGGWI